MCLKTLLSSIVLVVFLTGAAGKIETQEPAYSVVQAYALHEHPNGANGTIELLIDKRLAGPVLDELWGKGDWSFVFSPGSKLNDEFRAAPPRRAKLRIVDSAGRITRARDLDAPLAKLNAWNPAAGAHEIFFLSQDYSAGVGSYNGPMTTLLEVSDSSFHDIEALNTASKQMEIIRLMRSLKSDWQTKDREKGAEILSVSCKPRSDGSFAIEYVRYSLENGQWLEYKREVPGFWESDERFPDRSSFP